MFLLGMVVGACITVCVMACLIVSEIDETEGEK